MQGENQRIEEARVDVVKCIEHYLQLQQVVIERNRTGGEGKKGRRERIGEGGR